VSGKIHLVVIDPQNSFCRQVDPHQQQQVHDGELCVPGAWEDMRRVAALVQRLGGRLAAIHVTLDSHHLLHIAHPIWFRDTAGRHPEPYTIMREEQGRIIGSRNDANAKSRELGEFTTTRPDFLGRTIDYLRQLAASRRYPHCIWPPHCLIGTPGHNVVAPLMAVLLDWCRSNLRRINLTMKGSNPFVEHFSAVRAEVPDQDDPQTHLNRRLLDTWLEADEILLAGEAGSHCLANTLKDVADELPDDSFLKRCVLLSDGTSPVPGFEQYQQDFIARMTARGMRTVTCAEYLA
jgi:nicotinamidase/pyrazinamidase